MGPGVDFSEAGLSQQVLECSRVTVVQMKDTVRWEVVARFVSHSESVVVEGLVCRGDSLCHRGVLRQLFL